MTCTWCDNDAVSGGKRPRNYQGPDYLLACLNHERLIEKLGYLPVDVNEAATAERRSKLEAERAKK